MDEKISRYDIHDKDLIVASIFITTNSFMFIDSIHGCFHCSWDTERKDLNEFIIKSHYKNIAEKLSRGERDFYPAETIEWMWKETNRAIMSQRRIEVIQKEMDELDLKNCFNKELFMYKVQSSDILNNFFSGHIKAHESYPKNVFKFIEKVWPKFIDILKDEIKKA